MNFAHNLWIHRTKCVSDSEFSDSLLYQYVTLPRGAFHLPRLSLTQPKYPHLSAFARLAMHAMQYKSILRNVQTTPKIGISPYQSATKFIRHSKRLLKSNPNVIDCTRSVCLCIMSNFFNNIELEKPLMHFLVIALEKIP